MGHCCVSRALGVCHLRPRISGMLRNARLKLAFSLFYGCFYFVRETWWQQNRFLSTFLAVWFKLILSFARHLGETISPLEAENILCGSLLQGDVVLKNKG